MALRRGFVYQLGVIMNGLAKARMEKDLGEKIINKDVSRERALEIATDNELNKDMIDYWAGRSYHKQERASHGFN